MVILTDVFYDFQLTIRAQDNGSPRRSATETVFITVRRNLNNPEFSTTQYSTTILETTSPGTSILRVQASDRDSNVGFIILSLQFCRYIQFSFSKIIQLK